MNCGNCKATGVTTAHVRECYNVARVATKRTSPTPVRDDGIVAAMVPAQRTVVPEFVSSPATEKQIAYLLSLADKRDWSGGTNQVGNIDAGDVIMNAIDGKLISKREASVAIEYLKGCAYTPTTAVAQEEEAGDLESGMYRVPGDDPVAYSYVDRQDLVPFKEAVIYKVYRAVHGSGRMCAKVLVVDGPGEAHFEYKGLASKYVKASQRMTLEDAKEFGAIYGVCCNCGRTLTDEGSIEAGIGPVCAKKFA